MRLLKLEKIKSLFENVRGWRFFFLTEGLNLLFYKPGTYLCFLFFFLKQNFYLKTEIKKPVLECGSSKKGIKF